MLHRKLLLILIFEILFSILPMPSSSSLIEIKIDSTYVIWQTRINVDGDMLTLQTIPDINNDDHEDIFVSSKSGNLIFIDGRTGSIIRNGKNVREIKESKFLNNHLIIIDDLGITVYNQSFAYLFTIPYWSIEFRSARSEGYSGLQTFDGSDIVFYDDIAIGRQHAPRTLDSFSLFNSSPNWIFPLGDEFSCCYYPYRVDNLAILSPQRGVVSFSNWCENWQYIAIIDSNGNAITTIKTNLSMSTDLLPYDQTHFLSINENHLCLFSAVEDKCTLLWQTPLEYSPRLPLVAVDVNNDGEKEIILYHDWSRNYEEYWWKSPLYNGSNGELLYTIGYYFNDLAVVDDINGDGIKEMAVIGKNNTDQNNICFLSLEESMYNLLWSVNVSGNPQGIETIQDVDGDGNKDIIVATWDYLYCLWAGYDNDAPTVSITSPNNDSVIRSSIVTIVWNGSDLMSGIDNYEIKIDVGSWINAGKNISYTFTNVIDGCHKVEVKAVDKVGLSRISSVNFTVNTSLIGEPGWTEEIILFCGITAIVALAVFVFIRKKRRTK